MTTLENQLYSFSYSLCSGMAIAFLYDIFRIKRKVFSSGNITIIIEDFLYWLLAGIVLFISTFYGCQGNLRGYIFVGIFFGIILYVVLFSKYIIKAGTFIVLTIIKPFKYLINKLIYLYGKLKGIRKKSIE